MHTFRSDVVPGPLEMTKRCAREAYGAIQRFVLLLDFVLPSVLQDARLMPQELFLRPALGSLGYLRLSCTNFTFISPPTIDTSA